jgi:prepilin-type N-terminal cleavage/methylation domain-containing protein
MGQLGFTLMELIMVLAIMGLAAGLFLMNVEQNLRNAVRQSPQDVFFEAVGYARMESIHSKQVHWLWYESTEHAFLVGTDRESPQRRFPIAASDQKFLEQVVFWPVRAPMLRESRRPGDPLQRMSQPAERIRFDPTGVSSFVAVEWIYRREVADPEWQVLSPFANGSMEVAVR